VKVLPAAKLPALGKTTIEVIAAVLCQVPTQLLIELPELALRLIATFRLFV
jgi:hypothetical protein